jgi:hypothetical protein
VVARTKAESPETRPARSRCRHTRADRELCIETTLATEATDRWWGLELSFGAELDEVFGVTNNKQDVPYSTQALFTQALRMAREFPDLTVAASRCAERARLSFSVVGATCDIEIEHEEWATIRDRIDGLFNKGSFACGYSPQPSTLRQLLRRARRNFRKRL